VQARSFAEMLDKTVKGPDVLQRHDLMLARRLELHGLLQNADRMVMDYPFLSKAFRSSDLHTPVQGHLLR
jgi:hypothetical protein